MAGKTSFAAWPCTIARSVGVMGDAWTLLILRESFFFGARRYADFAEGLPIPSNILSDRLKKLVADGVLAKREAPMGRSPHEYRPTAKGAELWPVVAAISAWGNRWVTDEDLGEIPLQHRTCGSRLDNDRCPWCAVRPDLNEVGFVPGPLLDVFAYLFARWARKDFAVSGNTTPAGVLIRKLDRAGCLDREELLRLLRERKVDKRATAQLVALLPAA